MIPFDPSHSQSSANGLSCPIATLHPSTTNKNSGQFYISNFFHVSIFQFCCPLITRHHHQGSPANTLMLGVATVLKPGLGPPQHIFSWDSHKGSLDSPPTTAVGWNFKFLLPTTHYTLHPVYCWWHLAQGNGRAYMPLASSWATTMCPTYPTSLLNAWWHQSTTKPLRN